MNQKLFPVFIVSYTVIKYSINNILSFDACLSWIMLVENNFNKINVYLNIIASYLWSNILKHLIYNTLDRDSEMTSGCPLVLVTREKMAPDLSSITGD